MSNLSGSSNSRSSWPSSRLRKRQTSSFKSGPSSGGRPLIMQATVTATCILEAGERLGLVLLEEAQCLLPAPKARRPKPNRSAVEGSGMSAISEARSKLPPSRFIEKVVDPSEGSISKS